MSMTSSFDSIDTDLRRDGGREGGREGGGGGGGEGGRGGGREGGREEMCSLKFVTQICVKISYVTRRWLLL